MIEPEYDVAVVGGGISGMAAARALRVAGKTVVVLEASDRFGGRSWSEENPDGVLEHGGMYIGDDHHALIALGESVGMTRTPAPLDGQDVFVVDGERIVAVDDWLPAGTPFAEDVERAFAAIEDLAAAVGWEAPWEHPDAATLDSTTVQEWLDSNFDEPAVSLLHNAIFGPLLGAAPSEVSLLFWAYYVAECGGVDALTATRGGLQNEWWLEGASTVSVRIGAFLGDSARLNTPVSRIERSPGAAVLHIPGGVVVARQVILALPPASANRILFEPSLPAMRDQLQMRAPLGRIAKVVLRYEKRFWAERGLSGAVINTGEMPFYQLDATKSEEPNATVVAFIGGSSYDYWRTLDPEQQRAKYLAVVAEALGEEAQHPLHYATTDWPDEPWKRGGPVTFHPPGVLSAYGTALRASVGNIHIAGTEASPRHAGYMEGGVRAGQTSAAAAIAALDAAN